MTLEVYFSAVDVIAVSNGQRECLIYTSIAVTTGFHRDLTLLCAPARGNVIDAIRASAEANGERLSCALTELRPSRISRHN